MKDRYLSHDQIERIPESLREVCDDCGGQGECATSHKYTCYKCNGRGWVPKPGVIELIDGLRPKESK